MSLQSLHAGGWTTRCFQVFSKDPVEVEFAVTSLNIGDTSVEMHVKHVQVQFAYYVNEAHVQPSLVGKLIGVPIALYLDNYRNRHRTNF